MTAEIAILNTSAVALAADSAITIGDGPDAKIYNTVNKIFELSDKQPLALMIYGNLEFMRLPIETVAKLFRREVGNLNSFSTVRECAEEFLQYLETQVPYDDSHERQNRFHIIDQGLSSIAKDADNAILDRIRQRSIYLRSKSNSIAQKVIRDQIDILNKLNPSKCFRATTDAAMLRSIEQDVDALIDLRMSPVLDNITAKTRSDLKRLARCVLYREPLSDTRTGFVVVGFGEREICPSLEWIEADGIVRKKLKFVHIKSVDIGRHSDSAMIQPFAQAEMVARFIRGVDPVYDRYVHERVGNSLSDFASTILTTLIPDFNQRKAALRALAPTIATIAGDFQDESRNHQVVSFQDDVLTMVRFMPKQELANLAESLIDLTSLKRRVSREKETVGGEVDVAVVSKSEGLVWIKRKHYFPKDLNPRFFQRHYDLR